MSHKPDPVDALHAALLISELKIAGAARAIGRSPGVLYNKLSDSVPGNELTGREERALAEAIGTSAYVEAVAAWFGGVFFHVPDGTAAEDDVLQAYLNIVERMGDLSRELTAARANGTIEPDEFDRLTYKGHATMSAIKTLLAELETMVVAPAQSAPVSIRGAGSR
jgi:hypothetical protein